ncbi:MAG TPA: hypothetical protein VK775_22105 [Chthoniobacterales bacterium]|nr:hypothetical protein [Chthoniobacterales bacterium]
MKTYAFCQNKILFNMPNKDGIQLTAVMVFGLPWFLVSCAD